MQKRASDFALPAKELGDLAAAQDDFNAAYEVASNEETRTSGTVNKKNKMRKEFEAMLRQFLAEYITNNSKVMDWDRENMKLPIHKKNPTRHPIPGTNPVTTRIVRKAPGSYEVHYRDNESSESNAKPFGVQGAEIGFLITDKDVDNVTFKDFNRSAFDTHTPFKIQFDPADFGRKVHYAMRWENTRGEKGDWGAVESFIIG
jgi:hypothetical protein